MPPQYRKHCMMFGNRLENEIFPREWKKANIIPAHKQVINNNKLWASIAPAYFVENFSMTYTIFLSTVTNLI